MTTLLLGTDLTPEQRDYAETIRRSADALLELINNILDFSKIEAGKLELEEVDFELRSTLDDLFDGLAIQAQDKNLEMACLVEPDVPDHVRGDPGRLRQVLVNLLGNAIKFTPHGEVVLHVSVAKSASSNGGGRHREGSNQNSAPDKIILHFAVTDTGIGIPADKVDRLFEAFSQVDSSTTRRFGGTGLGLSISKRLVEMMGGTIGVKSKEGKGSTFWFTCPLIRAEAPTQATKAVSKLHGVRVLAVDDNLTNRKVLAGLLGSWGCRHTEVADAASALAQLHRAQAAGDPYRLAILDMQMPGMDGAELGAIIKGNPLYKDTALVMMTSVGHAG
ncbi:MAG: response regulator, partial [Thermoleophilia bacterium]|nr:response regulator [Thermoleophilia bacterium]